MSDGEIVIGLYEAFGRGDVPVVLAGFDDEIEWTEAEGFIYGGTYKGRDEILNGVLIRLATEWKGFQVKAEKVVDGGEGLVVVVGTEGGTYLATGEHAMVPCAHEWELRNGKVTRFRQHIDTAVFARQIGI